MSFTFELATPGNIVGRIVGERREHIAVAVIEFEHQRGNGVLLAVRADGTGYVTWRYGLTMDETEINVGEGHYFDGPNPVYGTYNLFCAAKADLVARDINS